MANVLHIGVENPDELLNTGQYAAGAIIRVQWSATQAGAFADVSGTGSTPTIPLVTLVTAYTAYDPAGTSTTWYRTRYENAGATRLSDWSDAFLVGSLVYCSREDVKQDLEKKWDDYSADELLDDYIADVTDFIRGVLGFDLLDATTIYTYDGYSAVGNGRCLPIPGGVRTISLLEVAPNTGGSFISLASTDFFLRPLQQDRAPGWPATEVWLNNLGAAYPYFPPGYANVRATGTFGFAAVPARVQGGARRTVVRAYAARQAGGNDLLGTGGDGGTPLVSQYLSRRDREVLETFNGVLVR